TAVDIDGDVARSAGEPHPRQRERREPAAEGDDAPRHAGTIPDRAVETIEGGDALTRRGMGSHRQQACSAELRIRHVAVPSLAGVVSPGRAPTARADLLVC